MQRLTIELLPDEIIEHIFLEALEVNLARASSAIAAAVSQERIYDAFMIHAFWNDPQDCIRRRHFDTESTYVNLRFRKRDYQESRLFGRKFQPARYQPMKIENQRELQSNVISCQWFKIHRFQRILPTLLALTLEALRLRERARFPLLKNQANHPSTNSKLVLNCDIDHDINDGYPKRLRIIDDLTIKATYQTPVHGKPHIIRTARILVFPDRILQGPWDTNRLGLLVNLRRVFGKRFGSFVSSVEKSIQSSIAPMFSDQACLRGMEVAIRQNSRLAITYLMDIRENFPLTCTSGIQKVPLPNHLLTMAMENDTTDFQILCLLMRALVPAIRPSSEMSKWTKLAILHGNLGARWLLGYLQGNNSSLSGIRVWRAIQETQLSKEPLLDSEIWVWTQHTIRRDAIVVENLSQAGHVLRPTHLLWMDYI